MQTKFKVVITASGIGSRLGDITQYLNKSLVRIGKKPAISYILENIDPDVPIVVTLGYKGDQVKEYLTIAHPERHFEFVEVERFEGPGSSLAYSLLCAKEHLNCNFVFIACDTVFSMPIFAPQENWLGVASTESSDQYTSVLVDKAGHVKKMQGKGAAHFDYAYVGIAGIKDHLLFWDKLTKLYEKQPLDSSLNDTRAFEEMLHEGVRFVYKNVTNWMDIGNESSLIKARQSIPDHFDNLEKLDESIYLFDDHFIVKFFHDTSIVQKRLKRAAYLKGLIPQIEAQGKHFYRYKYVMGDLFSQVVNPQNLEAFLHWCEDKLWTHASLSEDEKKLFPLHCKRFYLEKTLSRLSLFYQATGLQDVETVLNQQKLPPLSKMLERVDWQQLFTGDPRGFHGDLHFENVLYDDEEFCLLDWRQDFDGIIPYGDIYYDLAKLNHGMIISHDIVRKNLFHISVNQEEVTCEIMRPDNLVLCQEKFYQFLEKKQFNRYKVDILTALIFLNIAPLHHTPYNLFLYYFGKLRLSHALRSYVDNVALSLEETVCI